MQSRFSAFLMTCCALGLVPVPQDLRQYEVPESAAGIEGLLAAAFPGGTVSWQGTLAVEIEGVRKPVETWGFRVEDLGAEIRVAAAVELPNDIRDARRSLKALETFTPVRSRVVVLLMSHEGVPLDHRVIELGAEEALTEVSSLDLSEGGADGWPILLVGYRGAYADADWTAAISWFERVDAGTSEILTRIPESYWRRSRGGKETAGKITTEALSESEGLIHIGGKAVRFDCSVSCVVPTSLIL